MISNTPTKEDCENVRNYSNVFDVEIPVSLENAMSTFENDVNETTINTLKLELCRWITTSQHESFQDDLWVSSKAAALKILNGEDLGEV